MEVESDRELTATQIMLRIFAQHLLRAQDYFGNEDSGVRLRPSKLDLWRFKKGSSYVTDGKSWRRGDRFAVEGRDKIPPTIGSYDDNEEPVPRDQAEAPSGNEASAYGDCSFLTCTERERGPMWSSLSRES